jgi:hypothetical protein
MTLLKKRLSHTRHTHTHTHTHTYIQIYSTCDLGRYDTPEEAASAYNAAVQWLGAEVQVKINPIDMVFDAVSTYIHT